MTKNTGLKFFIKWRMLYFLARIATAVLGGPIDRADWEARLLIVDLHGLGDVIFATPALRAYRNAFPRKRIYLAVTLQSGLTRDAFAGLVDEIVAVDIKKFHFDPFYAARTIRRLRAIGFATVVNECLGLTEKASKVISVSLGADKVVGYEGPGVELLNPLSAPFLGFSKKHIFPKYTTLVPSIDKDFKEKKSHPQCAIRHHLAIAQAVTGQNPPADVSTVFHVEPAAERSAWQKLEKLGFPGGRYAVIVPGASDAGKRWPGSRFSAVAEMLWRKGLRVVVIGSRSERALGNDLGSGIMNAAGLLTLPESAAVIKNAYVVFTNDTGPVHIAVALGVPSICIPAGAHLYMNSLYGRKEINRWVFKDVGCLYDDWRCLTGAGVGGPAPCIDAVSADAVIAEFDDLEKTITSFAGRSGPFLAGF